jgi:hypothetical protein
MRPFPVLERVGAWKGLRLKAFLEDRQAGYRRHRPLPFPRHDDQIKLLKIILR